MGAGAWRLAAALVLALDAVATFVYAPLIPAPVLPDVALGVPLLGPVPAAWLVLAAAYLLSAVGVARRWRWARVSAGLLGGWLLASGLATLIAQPLLRGPSSPGALVAVLLGAVVLFAVLRRW